MVLILMQRLCKLIVMLFNYLLVAQFFWMLVEGLHLHMFIVWAFAIERIRLWHYIVLGWGQLHQLILCFVTTLFVNVAIIWVYVMFSSKLIQDSKYYSSFYLTFIKLSECVQQGKCAKYLRNSLRTFTQINFASLRFWSSLAKKADKQTSPHPIKTLNGIKCLILVGRIWVAVPQSSQYYLNSEKFAQIVGLRPPMCWTNFLPADFNAHPLNILLGRRYYGIGGLFRSLVCLSYVCLFVCCVV